MRKNWINNALKEYVTQSHVITQSHFGWTLRLLEENSAHSFLKDNLEILIVGPGGYSETGFCPYELYELSAYLEYHHINYHASVVDIKEEIIEKVLDRRVLSITTNDIDIGMNRAGFKENWDLYHERIGAIPYELKGHEVFRAPIPQGLKNMLNAGDVKTYAKDIVFCDLPEKKYDLIICRNMLNQLNELGNRIVLERFSKSSKNEALIWLNIGMIFSSQLSKNIPNMLEKKHWFKPFGFKYYKTLYELNGLPADFMYKKR